MADAAVAAGTTLLIWSSLPNVAKMTNGELSHMRHFDSKARVEEYVRSLPIIGVFRNPEGVLVLSQPWQPTTGVPLIDIADTGAYLLPVLLSPSPAPYNGEVVMAATAYYTPSELVAAWSRVLGEEVRCEQVALGAMAKMLSETEGFFTAWRYSGLGGDGGVKKARELVELVGGELTEWEKFLGRELGTA